MQRPLKTEPRRHQVQRSARRPRHRQNSILTELRITRLVVPASREDLPVPQHAQLRACVPHQAQIPEAEETGVGEQVHRGAYIFGILNS